VTSIARVLIVEDDVLQADNLEALVTLRGHKICGSVRTGEAAVALAKAAAPDVVLMDVALAGPMDGIEAAGHIRSQASCGLVFITAYGDRSKTGLMQQVNPIAILMKPVSESDIHAAIERATAGRAGPP
jgi:DNA-binding NarL/FixJ family response regulator